MIIEEWEFIILAERALQNPVSNGKNKIKQSQRKVQVVIPAFEKLMEKDHKSEGGHFVLHSETLLSLLKLFLKENEKTL